jgi:hypothetical protein
MKNVVLISIFLFLVSCASQKYPTIWAHNPKYTADMVGLRNIMVDLPANSKIAILDVPAESKEIMEVMLEKTGFNVVKKSEPQDSSVSSDPVSIGKSLGVDIVIVGKTELESNPGSRLTLRALRVADGELISLSRIYASKFFLENKENVPQMLSFIDTRDGQVYNVNKIGNLIWMSQNLNYEAGDSKCFDNDVKNCRSYYGRLYKWDEAQNICPNGWRLPSTEEWRKMADSASTIKKDGDINLSFVIDYDIYGNYSFWTASETSKSKASYVYMNGVAWVSGGNKVARVFYDVEKKSSYFSVRCVR